MLEAVFYLGAGKSCRSANDRELIHFGKPEGCIEAAIFSQGREQTLKARLSVNTRRSLFVNEVKLATPRELLGRLPCVFFGPEELGIVRAGASARRRYMDLALCQLRPRYMALLAEYNRLHKHKTRLLRDAAPGSAMASVLPDFNRRMAEVGAGIVFCRADFVKRAALSASGFHQEAAGDRETLCLSYVTKPVFDENLSQGVYARILYEYLKDKEPSEWAAGRCLAGPHRDDIETSVGGVSAREYGSQGQTRTAALAMKMAERQIFREELGAYPVLLLDDVLSELDAHRQEFVLNHIEEGQVLITCCEDGTRFPAANTIKVKEGKAKPCISI